MVISQYVLFLPKKNVSSWDTVRAKTLPKNNLIDIMFPMDSLIMRTCTLKVNSNRVIKISEALPQFEDYILN